ncbi:hypothetical protein Dda_7866 [Drechslerella dactyloides]|uniref:Uncharacterized protein n=1 Tax=Drechslerella dactyloides TaxID=74499 RepID=A0AAD6IR04_DREDA|nr:hypothetical protein Dda_7866 [Drechslerella dactyloides]
MALCMKFARRVSLQPAITLQDEKTVFSTARRFDVLISRTINLLSSNRIDQGWSFDRRREQNFSLNKTEPLPRAVNADEPHVSSSEFITLHYASVHTASNITDEVPVSSRASKRTGCADG